jgi:hypothetical protein
MVDGKSSQRDVVHIIDYTSLVARGKKSRKRQKETCISTLRKSEETKFIWANHDMLVCRWVFWV